jgi:hypothetical protein
VAEADVALALRDFRGSPRALAAAASTLDEHGDRANALHARLIAVRRSLLLGRIDEAASGLARLNARFLPPPLLAIAEMTAAEVSLRTLRTGPARSALARAHAAAERAHVPALLAEVNEARAALDRPAARRVNAGHQQALLLDEVEALINSDALIVDACRRGLRAGTTWLPLTRRPVLFDLARVLAQAWPDEVDRNVLIERVFRTRRPNESHRARLRVEIGRLRALAARLARIEATAHGFAIKPVRERAIVVLEPPIDGEQASLQSLLADGAPWSTHALAMALGASQRTIQRALVELENAGRVRSIGRGRTQRWLSPPLTGFTTILLLPASLAPA